MYLTPLYILTLLFNLGSGEDGICQEIRAIGIDCVISEFGEYGLEEIGKEFASSANESEKEYILPKMVGGTKVHLLVGVKNTSIQATLLRVLSSGVGSLLESLQRCVGI